MMANPQFLPVEGYDMVIIVAGGKTGGDDRRDPGFQIETVEESLAIINQKPAIGRPVGGLEGQG